MTPPPALVERNFSGKPSIPTSQSMTCVSSSVHAGLVDQSIPCTPKPEDSRSPRIPGPEALHGKYAKKFGDCQCVTPGKINRSTSFSTASNSSPLVGGSDGSDARICPGSTRESTGKDSMRD